MIPRGLLNALDGHVEQFGWGVIVVGAHAGKPSFAYTVGLHGRSNWPEIIIFGLLVDEMRSLLNAAVNELRGRELTPIDGLLLSNVAQGFDCRLKAIHGHHPTQDVTIARQYAKAKFRTSKAVRAIQLIWPDAAGMFPDEDACADPIKALQPLPRVH